MPGGGHVLRVRRRPGGFHARIGPPVSFVACAGAGIDEARPAPILPAHDMGATRSLWLTSDRVPDGSATAVYGAVWFSADKVS